MRKNSLSFFARTLILVAFSGVWIQTRAADKAKPEAPRLYSSPDAVFNAFREASKKHDWRTAFFCLTPQAREAAVLEAFSLCNLSTRNPKIPGILKKFGAEGKVVYAEYQRRYREKYGEAPQEIKPAPPAFSRPPSPFPEEKDWPPFPPRDQDLLRKIVNGLITDKPGFYEAVNNILEYGRAPIGKLEDLIIQGDTATGQASKTLYVINIGAGGRPEKELEEALKEIYCFRKLNGAWFIDKREEDPKLPKARVFPIPMPR